MNSISPLSSRKRAGAFCAGVASLYKILPVFFAFGHVLSDSFCQFKLFLYLYSQ